MLDKGIYEHQPNLMLRKITLLSWFISIISAMHAKLITTLEVFNSVIKPLLLLILQVYAQEFSTAI